MRPSSIASPGALLRHRIGPAVDQGTDSPPSPACCENDPDSVPDRGASENGGQAVKLSSVVGLPSVVQSNGNDVSNAVPNSVVVLDTPVTVGNRLYAAHVMRSGGLGTWPAGWDAVDDVEFTGSGAGTLEVRTKIAEAGDESLTIVKGGSFYAWIALVELTGAGAVVDVVSVNDSTSDPENPTISGATATDDDTLAIATFICRGIDNEMTEGAGFALLEEGIAGNSPTTLTEAALVDTGSVSADATALPGTEAWAGILVLFAPGSEPTWTVPTPTVIDDDPATYTTITGPELIRLDLGAEYRIQRMLVRIGTTTSGSKTLTWDAWNEPNESDRVTVNATDFTATGSLTLQDVTDEWYTTESYRYWQLDGPAEVVRVATVSLFEGTVDIAHQHTGTNTAFDNTDSDLPGDPDTVQEAIDIIVDEFVRVRDGGGEVISTVAASGSTETIDLADGNVHDVTLTDDCTFTFTSPAAGRARSFTLFLRQGASPPHLVTWPGSVEWAGGSAPTLSTALDDVDVLTFVTLDGGTVWYGFAAGGGGAVSSSGFPRPLMAEDAGDPGTWYVVVDGDGNAVMITG